METNSPPVIPHYPLHPQAPEWHPKGRHPFRVQIPTTFLEQNALQLQQNRIVELLAEQHRKSTLPRPQVPIFNGDPTSYRSFIRAFESLIESKTSDSCDRLYYLDQYKKTPGMLKNSCDLVKTCQLTEDTRKLVG